MKPSLALQNLRNLALHQSNWLSLGTQSWVPLCSQFILILRFIVLLLFVHVMFKSQIAVANAAVFFIRKDIYKLYSTSKLGI